MMIKTISLQIRHISSSALGKGQCK